MDERGKVVVSLFIALILSVGLFFYANRSPHEQEMTQNTMRISVQLPGISASTHQGQTAESPVPEYVMWWGNNPYASETLPLPLVSLFSTMKYVPTVRMVPVESIPLVENGDLESPLQGLQPNLFAAYYALSNASNTATFLVAGPGIFFVSTSRVYFLWYSISMDEFVGIFVPTATLYTFSGRTFTSSVISASGTPVVVTLFNTLKGERFVNTDLKISFGIYKDDFVFLPPAENNGTYVFIYRGSVFKLNVGTSFPTEIKVNGMILIVRKK